MSAIHRRLTSQLRQLPHGDGRPLQPEQQALHLLKVTQDQPRATLALLQVAAQSNDFSLEVDGGT
jgi:hypothetical protein